MGEYSSAIDDAYVADVPKPYTGRRRIGAGIIGHPCQAYMAFSLRNFPELPHRPNLKRIFRDGHTIEKGVVADLRKAGYTVHDVDPMTGKQYQWTRNNGLLVYKADGIVEKLQVCRLLEIKSMNDASWTQFKNKGIKNANRKYYHQLNTGMGMSGYRSAVIVAYNKDTSHYWDEVIEFDEIAYYERIYIAEQALTNRAEKIGKNSADWRCKDCSLAGVCWQNDPVPQNMASCANALPVGEGQWQCPHGCVDVCLQWQRYVPKDRST